MNPIDILLDPISLIVLAIYGGLMLWEAVLPGRTLPKIKHWKIRGLTSFLFFFYLSTYLPMFWDTFFSNYQLFNVEYLGTYGGAFIAVMVYELGVYFWHRAMHRSDRLWRTFHQMHHSAERLDSYGAFYFSPWDMVGWTLLGSVCMVMIVGLTPEAATLALLTTTFLGMFQHTNIRTPQWLGYLIQRPESHTVHHAKGVHAYNYSDLPIYDILFGTFKNPAAYEYETGFYDGASKRVWEMIKGQDVEKPNIPKKEMKVLVSLGVLLMLTQLMDAQTINYQGALRDLNGQAMAGASTDLRISFYRNDSILFMEEHQEVTTNDAGIFNLRIGSANPEGLQQIDFGGDVEIQTEIKQDGNYEIINFENIAVVPLALHAKFAENVDDADADPGNELQEISFDASSSLLTLSDGGSVDLSSLDDDAGSQQPGTDDQKLSISGTILTIEDGNSLDLAVLQDGVEDGDSDPSNEIQTLSRSNDKIVLSGNGGEVVDNVNDPDSDPANEIQKLSFNQHSKKLKLSKQGGEIDLSDLVQASQTPWSKDGRDLYYFQGAVKLNDLKIAETLSFEDQLRIDKRAMSADHSFFIDVPDRDDLGLNTQENSGSTLIGNNGKVVLAFGSGEVGIGDPNPAARLHIAKGSNVNSVDGGTVIIGKTSRPNMAIGTAAIQARNNGNATDLRLNMHGGAVMVGQRNNVSTNMYINQGADVGSNFGGSLQVGTAGNHLAVGSAVLQARINHGPSELRLNPFGGNVVVGKKIYAKELRKFDSANLQYNTSTGEFGYDTSTKRDKSNISDFADDWKKILHARPVKYDRPTSPGEWEYGYIAEEMDSLGLTNLVAYDQQGLPENFNYEKMILYLTEVIKMHEDENSSLHREVASLSARLEKVEMKLIVDPLSAAK